VRDRTLIFVDSEICSKEMPRFLRIAESSSMFCPVQIAQYNTIFPSDTLSLVGIDRRQFGASVVGGSLGTIGRLWALAPRPQLVVLVILEQTRPDYVDAARPLFSTGGFRKLLEKGTYFPDCRHNASTFPASTLATLATGAWPAQHGVVADRWYDRAIRRVVSASGEELLGTPLAAQIAGGPGARVVRSAMTPR